MEKKVNPRHIRRRRVLRTVILLLGLGSIGGIAAVSGIVGAYYFVQPSLQSAEAIRDIRLEVPLRIFSREVASITSGRPRLVGAFMRRRS